MDILNCMSPLKCRFFNKYCIFFFLFLITFFSLEYFKNTICNTSNTKYVLIDYVISKVSVNSRLLILGFEEVKSNTQIFDCVGVLHSMLFKGQL